MILFLPDPGTSLSLSLADCQQTCAPLLPLFASDGGARGVAGRASRQPNDDNDRQKGGGGHHPRIIDINIASVIITRCCPRFKSLNSCCKCGSSSQLTVFECIRSDLPTHQLDSRFRYGEQQGALPFGSQLCNRSRPNRIRIVFSRKEATAVFSRSSSRRRVKRESLPSSLESALNGTRNTHLSRHRLSPACDAGADDLLIGSLPYFGPAHLIAGDWDSEIGNDLHRLDDVAREKRGPGANSRTRRRSARTKAAGNAGIAPAATILLPSDSLGQFAEQSAHACELPKARRPLSTNEATFSPSDFPAFLPPYKERNFPKSRPASERAQRAHQRPSHSSSPTD